MTPSSIKSASFQLIGTKADILVLAGDSNNYNQYCILLTNIDMEGQVFGTAIIAPNTSSSISFYGTAFTGTFDGNGHKITNFTISGGGNSYLGLFGYIGVRGEVKNLGIENFSISEASGSRSVGGIAGYNFYGTISNCYATGTVNGSYSVGGLAGTNAFGSIRSSHSTGVVSGDHYTGGLVGYNTFGSISNCYSKSSVSNNSYDYTGGLVGYNYHGSINDCYATGDVSSYFYVGGLVGYNSYGSISNCYSTGFVSGSSGAGGLISRLYNGVIQNSFWDTQTSGQTTSAGGTGKTTTEMKTLSTFTSAGWDFTNIWDICEGTNYPRLVWQIPLTDWVCPYGVNTEDLNYFVNQWLENDCNSSNDYCDGVDIDTSGKVDLEDWTIFAGWWLEGI